MPKHDEDFLQLSQYSCCCYNCTSTRQKRNGGMAEYGRVCLKTNRNVSGAQFEILWAWISRLLTLPTAVTPPSKHTSGCNHSPFSGLCGLMSVLIPFRSVLCCLGCDLEQWHLKFLGPNRVYMLLGHSAVQLWDWLVCGQLLWLGKYHGKETVAHEQGIQKGFQSHSFRL